MSHGGEAPFDLALVGGGLHNGLLALALRHRQPDLRLVVIERGARAGGNHTWCLHAGDVPAEARPYVEPLIAHRWPGYSVHFPGFSRALDEPYALISSARFGAHLAATLGDALWCGAEAVRVEAGAVQLADGRRVTARRVIDARGPRAVPADVAGFQKFVGLEVRLATPHGLERPILMDATVPQHDGLRFFYVLPLDPTRLLIEDTRFADGARLDEADLEAEVQAYAATQGWAITAIERRESGALPMPWAAPTPAPREGALLGGYAAGFFHPATGYSLPIAVRVAEALSRVPLDALPAAHAAQAALQAERQRFAFALNRALFRHCAPADRWRLMARFYRRPAPVIRRFYALRLTALDRLRLLAGLPPRGLRLRPLPRLISPVEVV
ncbi:MAG: lycopene beta-cyclase CrtY [Myxococcales bacterium]|nr:lycopene beta-cyclase CrtY [Myxococcales bacterium]